MTDTVNIEVVTEAAPVVKTQWVKRNETATSAFVATVDAVIDDFLKIGAKLDASKILERTKVSKSVMEEVRTELKADEAQFAEVLAAMESKEKTDEQKQVVEGWSNVSKKELRTILDFYAAFQEPVKKETKVRKEKKETLTSTPEVIEAQDELVLYCKQYNCVQVYKGNVQWKRPAVKNFESVGFYRLKKNAPVGSYDEVMESVKTAKLLEYVPTGRISKIWEEITK